MRKIIFLCCLFHLLTLTLTGQTLSVFDVDTSAFPTIKAKFFAFDKDGKQIINLSTSDFQVKENGQLRNVTNVSCPSPKPPIAISSVLVMDVSGSMCGDGLNIAKAAADVWVNMLPLGRSDCAITSFSDDNYINQDFTTDKTKLINAINSLVCMDGTDYNAAMIDPPAGGIIIAKTGKHKRVIVFLSDGGPNSEPNTAQIISMANANNISIYCVTIGMPAPQCMKDFANQTGGLYFENIKTKEEAEDCYLRILQIAQGGNPCSIEWQTEKNCYANRSCSALLKTVNIQSEFVYEISKNYLSKIMYSPSFSIKFDTVSPPNSQIKDISITARNKDIIINNVTISNPDFQIVDWGGSPPPFTLSENQSRNLKIQFKPIRKGYAFCSFNFESDVCIGNSFFTRTSFTNDTTAKNTLKLLKPNGGEFFIAGEDTVITWEGVLPQDKVCLEFSADSGTNWNKIADYASQFKYKWNIWGPASSRCLMRVKLQEDDKQAANDLIRAFGFQRSVFSVVYSPDGNYLAVAHGRLVSLIDLKSKSIVKTFVGHTDNAGSLAFSPDGLKLFSGSNDGTIKIWDVNSRTLVTTIYCNDYGIYSIAISPDGSILAYSDGGTIKLLDINSETEIYTISGHTGAINSVAFSPDGSTLASGSSDNTIKLWDILSGTEIKTLSGHTNEVNSVIFSPDGTKLASGSLDATIKLWDIKSGSEIRTFSGHNSDITSLAFSPDGNILASGSGDYTIKLWNTNTGNEIKLFSNYLYMYVAFSPDGTKIAGGGFQHITIWDINTGNEVDTYKGHESFVFSVAFSPDGKMLASSSYDQTVILWGIDKGNIIKTLTGHKNNVNSVAFSLDGTKLASGSSDNTIKLWDVNSGAEISSFKNESYFSRVFSVAFSPDGTKLASGSDDGTIKLWDVNSGVVIKTLSGHKSYVNSVAFSPDGTKIISGSNDSTLKLWDVNSGTEIRTYTGHKKEVKSVAYSPDGTRLASGSYDGTVRLWDVNSGAEICTFIMQNNNYVYSVAFSPDGSMLASSQWLEVDLWDLNSESQIKAFRGHNDNVYDVAFSPDGKKLVSAGEGDYSALLWNVELPQKKNLQEDVSDSVFTIVEPQAASFDIDMKQALVGTFKDSIITGFITNTGSYPCRIDTIFIEMGDVDQFALVSGFHPCTIDVGQSKSVEFRFKPTSAGNKFSIIMIYLQSGMFSQSIIGEGVIPVLSVENKLIDFGKVLVGSIKDTMDLATIKNIGTASITIDSTKHNKPNYYDFSTLAGSAPFILNPGETAKMDLRFKPSDVGRTSGVLEFYYNGVGSPAVITLYGEGIIDTVSVPDDFFNTTGIVQLFSINPNPASDEAEIEFELIESARTQLFVSNILGEKVLTLFDGIPDTGRQRIRFNTNDLPQGNYFVILRTPTIIKTQRIEVIR